MGRDRAASDRRRACVVHACVVHAMVRTVTSTSFFFERTRCTSRLRGTSSCYALADKTVRRAKTVLSPVTVVYDLSLLCSAAGPSRSLCSAVCCPARRMARRGPMRLCNARRGGTQCRGGDCRAGTARRAEHPGPGWGSTWCSILRLHRVLRSSVVDLDLALVQHLGDTRREGPADTRTKTRTRGHGHKIWS